MNDQPQLDAAQKAAAEHPGDRVLCIAGAGSGKSRTLIARINWLVASGVPPCRICCLTFTTAASKVLLDRLGYRLGYTGTLHSCMLKLLRRYGSNHSLGVIDEERAVEVLEETKSAHRYKGSPDAVEQALRRWEPLGVAPSPSELVVAAYRRRLQQSGVTDFDGLIYHGRKLLEAFASPDGVEPRNSQPFPFSHLLVDEFQDSSSDFAAVYEAMPVKSRSFTGDPWQSIFSFLGGSIKHIMEEASSGGNVVRLETNYRCCKNVCEAASKLIKAGGGTERALPRPGAPEGSAIAHECKDFEDEVLFIAQSIRSLERGRSCAVLLRTNSLVSQYALALKAYGIPIAEKKDSAAPKDWKAVRALIACLQEPDNDLLSEGLVSALRGPRQAAQSRKEAAMKMVSVNEHCLHLKAAKTAHEAVAFALTTKPSPESKARLEAAATQLELDADVGELLVALQEPPKQEQKTPGVFVSTVHSVKGLEFSCVFVAAAEEGIIPSARDAKEPESLAEARRLAYVAFTRAEDTLVVTHCKQRQEKFGRFATVDMLPSRFITEAGLTLT